MWTYVTSAFTASWGGCLKNNTIDRLRRRFSAVLPQFLACLGLDYIQTIDVVCISLTLPQTRVLSFFYLISFFFVLRTTCHQPRLRHCINNSMIPTLGDATVTWHDIVLGEGETGERTIL